MRNVLSGTEASTKLRLHFQVSGLNSFDSSISVTPCLRTKLVCDSPKGCAMMLNSLKYLVALVGIVLVSACAPTVYTDADPSKDFSTLRTFSWANLPPLIKTGDHPVSALTEANVTNALRAELERKGYQFVSSGAADFAVSYTMGARDKIELRQYPVSYTSTYSTWGWGGRYYGRGYRGPYGTFGPPVTTTEAVNVTEGTLSVDVFDVASRRPIWHAQASRRLSASELSTVSEERSSEIAATILSEFPARSAVAAAQ